MKKKPRCRSGSFYWWVILFVVVAGPWTSASAQQEDRIWKGAASDQKEEFIQVVEDLPAWTDLWKRAFGQPAPAVDFEKFVVACVFLGHNADWLFSIGFGEPYLQDKGWVLPYELVELVLELSGPFKASGQYGMKVYERKEGNKMILKALDPSVIKR